MSPPPEPDPPKPDPPAEPTPAEGGVALDTNILARLMLDDAPEPSALARGLVGRIGPERPAFVGREVLAELVWVLRARGRRSRAAVAAALDGLLDAPELRVEAAASAREAVRRQAPGAPGVADLMILAAARRAGHELWTFDRVLAREPGARLLGPGSL